MTSLDRIEAKLRISMSAEEWYIEIHGTPYTGQRELEWLSVTENLSNNSDDLADALQSVRDLSVLYNQIDSLLSDRRNPGIYRCDTAQLMLRDAKVSQDNLISILESQDVLNLSVMHDYELLGEDDPILQEKISQTEAHVLYRDGEIVDCTASVIDFISIDLVAMFTLTRERLRNKIVEKCSCVFYRADRKIVKKFCEGQ